MANPTAPAAARPAAAAAVVPRTAPAATAQLPKAPETTAGTWKRLFNDWPSEIPRRGVVVNTLNEQLPFKAFMVKGEMVLLERTNPDTLGSRFIFVPYTEIGLVKLIDPIKQQSFEASGFVGSLYG